MRHEGEFWIEGVICGGGTDDDFDFLGVIFEPSFDPFLSDEVAYDVGSQVFPFLPGCPEVVAHDNGLRGFCGEVSDDVGTDESGSTYDEDHDERLCCVVIRDCIVSVE